MSNRLTCAPTRERMRQPSWSIFGKTNVRLAAPEPSAPYIRPKFDGGSYHAGTSIANANFGASKPLRPARKCEKCPFRPKSCDEGEESVFRSEPGQRLAEALCCKRRKYRELRLPPLAAAPPSRGETLGYSQIQNRSAGRLPSRSCLISRFLPRIQDSSAFAA